MKIIEEKIKVEYQEHMGSDLVVVNAARASFGKESNWFGGLGGRPHYGLKTSDASLIRFLASGYRSEEWADLLQQVVNCTTPEEAEQIIKAARKRPTHWAPFAHPQLRIRMTIPVFLARQAVKHQVGAVWSEESRRYISDAPTFWFPEQWHSRPEDVKQGSGEVLSEYPQAQANFTSLLSTQTTLRSYEHLMSLGVAPEEARTVLPLNHMTTVVWTGSLLFWARVCNLRLDGHAQLAAQELAGHIRDIAEPLFPVSWKELVG